MSVIEAPSINILTAHEWRKWGDPHFRHTAAMELLQNGVDTSVIALWLGHESVETTQIYIHANLQIKEQVLEKTSPIDISPGRFKPDDQLLCYSNKIKKKIPSYSNIRKSRISRFLLSK